MPTRQPQEYFTVDNIGTQETDMANIKTVARTTAPAPAVAPRTRTRGSSAVFSIPTTASTRTRRRTARCRQSFPMPNLPHPFHKSASGLPVQHRAAGATAIVPRHHHAGEPHPHPGAPPGARGVPAARDLLGLGKAAVLHRTLLRFRYRTVREPAGRHRGARTHEHQASTSSPSWRTAEKTGTYTQKRLSAPPATKTTGPAGQGEGLPGRGRAPPVPGGWRHGAVAVSKGTDSWRGVRLHHLCAAGPEWSECQQHPPQRTIGTRAWSGEVTDSSGVSAVHQRWIFKQGHGGQCRLHQQIMKADEKQVDTVLEHVRACQEAAAAGRHARPPQTQTHLGRPRRHAAPVGKLLLPEQRHGRGRSAPRSRPRPSANPRASGVIHKGSPCLLRQKKLRVQHWEYRRQHQVRLKGRGPHQNPLAAARRKAFCAPQTTEADCTSAKNAPYCEWKG